MNKAYKFRIYPNSEQRTMLSKNFGCTRMIYNYYLNKRIKLISKDVDNLDIMKIYRFAESLYPDKARGYTKKEDINA